MPRRPATGAVTSGYGPREAPTAGASTWHLGVDLVGEGNDAPEHGVLASYSYAGGFGWLAVLLGGSGWWHYLAHNRDASPLVPVGSRVAEGQRVAVMGMTGTATGDHVHWEVHAPGESPGTTIDPLAWLTQAATGSPAPIESSSPNGETEMLIAIALNDSADKIVRKGIGYVIPSNGPVRPIGADEYGAYDYWAKRGIPYRRAEWDGETIRRVSRGVGMADWDGELIRPDNTPRLNGKVFYDDRAKADYPRTSGGAAWNPSAAQLAAIGQAARPDLAPVLAAVAALDAQADDYQAKLAAALAGVDEATVKTLLAALGLKQA